MNQDTPGCGNTKTMGHGEGATCGQSFYGSPWYCSACTMKAAIAAAVAAERERCASAVMAQVEACAEHTYGYTREAAIAFGKEDKFDSHCAQAEEILAIAAMAIKKG